MHAKPLWIFSLPFEGSAAQFFRRFLRAPAYAALATQVDATAVALCVPAIFVLGQRQHLAAFFAYLVHENKFLKRETTPAKGFNTGVVQGLTLGRRSRSRRRNVSPAGREGERASSYRPGEETGRIYYSESAAKRAATSRWRVA